MRECFPPSCGQNNDEIDSSAEHLMDGPFSDLLNGVGNHEAKLLTTALVASHPDRWFTQTMLTEEFRSRQGESPQWMPGGSVLSHYCINSLGPIGAVVKGKVAGKLDYLVDAYKTTEFGQEWGLPFAGLALQWSLNHPNLSLQQLFGATHTNKDQVRSPQARYQIYLDLLTKPEGSSSVEIYRSLLGADYSSEQGITKQLEALNDLGFVIFSSSHLEYNPRIKILDPSFKHNSMDFSEVKDATRIAYDTLQHLFNNGQLEPTLEEVLKTTEMLNPTANLVKVRHYLIQLTAPGSSQRTLAVIDRGNIPITKMSHAYINPAHYDAIEELCSDIERFRDEESVREEHKKSALTILDNSQHFSNLMGKARQFSVCHRAMTDGRELLSQQILSIIKTAGNTTSESIQEQLKTNHGRFLTRGGIQIILNSLMASGSVTLETLRPDSSKRSHVKSYTFQEML